MSVIKLSDLEAFNESFWWVENCTDKGLTSERAFKWDVKKHYLISLDTLSLGIPNLKLKHDLRNYPRQVTKKRGWGAIKTLALSRGRITASAFKKANNIFLLPRRTLGLPLLVAVVSSSALFHVNHPLFLLLSEANHLAAVRVPFIAISFFPSPTPLLRVFRSAHATEHRRFLLLPGLSSPGDLSSFLLPPFFFLLPPLFLYFLELPVRTSLFLAHAGIDFAIFAVFNHINKLDKMKLSSASKKKITVFAPWKCAENGGRRKSVIWSTIEIGFFSFLDSSHFSAAALYVKIDPPCHCAHYNLGLKDQFKKRNELQKNFKLAGL